MSLTVDTNTPVYNPEQMQQTGPTNQAGQTEQLANSTTVQQVVASVLPLLQGDVRVSTTSGTDKDMTTRDITGAPVIEGADKGSETASLDAVVALLMLESEEEQIKSSQERLKTQLDRLNAEQKDVMEKLNKSIEECKMMEENQKTSSILGWIMAALSVIAAAVSIVLTCGAATPLAVTGCVLACTSAALSITNMALQESGAMKEHVEERAEEMMKKDPSLSRSEAMEKAQKEWDMGWGITQAVLGLASLGVGIASLATSGAKAAADLGKEIVEGVEKTSKLASASFQLGAKITSLITQVSSLGVGIASTVNAFQAADLIKDQAEAEADLKEAQAMLDLIQQAVEEEEELLQQLISKMNDTLSALCELLGSSNDAINDILNQFKFAGV